MTTALVAFIKYDKSDISAVTESPFQQTSSNQTKFIQAHEKLVFCAVFELWGKFVESCACVCLLVCVIAARDCITSHV